MGHSVYLQAVATRVAMANFAGFLMLQVDEIGAKKYLYAKGKTQNQLRHAGFSTSRLETKTHASFSKLAA